MVREGRSVHSVLGELCLARPRAAEVVAAKAAKYTSAPSAAESVESEIEAIA